MRPVSAQAAFEFLIEQLRGAVPPENVVKWSNYIETVEQALDRFGLLSDNMFAVIFFDRSIFMHNAFLI